MKNQTKESLGFTAEILSFFISGFLFSFQKYLLSSIFLAIGFILAIKVGDLIKKRALSGEYK